ncbi:MAG: DegV family protein [Actinomycetota bacterium]|jgi:DegV family protein with EDD domain|nr:DegV family protein [Actinomycetota bacterium]
MSRVAIVCDSTCDLSLSWLADHDVEMVPLKVHFEDEGQSYLDWIEMEPEQFYKRLVSADQLPKTSQPSPADFSVAYAKAVDAGAEEIVSVHLTAALSGTYESAMMAAKNATVPVHIVDTKMVSQATALVVKAAVDARDAGLSGAEMASRLEQMSDDTTLFFILDTLEYLVKGGRAGKAAGLASSVLNIKPVLTFDDEGRIEPFKKVKGLKKAMAALAEHVAEVSKAHTIKVALLYSTDTGLADEMQHALDAAGAVYDLDSTGPIGSVIGTYAGPRAVGVAYHKVD